MSDDKNKDSSIVSGILLIAIGLIALLVTFFDIEIDWEELAKLWPVFIIIFGVSLLPLSKLLKSILVIVLILISCLIYCHEVKDDESCREEYYEYKYSDPEHNSF